MEFVFAAPLKFSEVVAGMASEAWIGSAVEGADP